MLNPSLNVSFHGPELDPRLTWHCPPSHWSLDRSHLVVRPDAGTDFWQRTHYGFCADNGHFLHGTVTGDFVLSTRVRSFPVHQYDQAGLMVRAAADLWIKTSVEFEPDEPSRLGAVLTRDGYSDWSTQDFPADRDSVELRVTLKDQTVLVEYLAPGVPASQEARPRWAQMRLAHLPMAKDRPVQAGLYACSPKGAGFMAQFDYLNLTPLQSEAPPAG